MKKIRTVSEALDEFRGAGNNSYAHYIRKFFDEKFMEASELEPQFRLYMNDLAILNGNPDSKEWRAHRSFHKFIVSRKITLLTNDVAARKSRFTILLDWRFERPSRQISGKSYGYTLEVLARFLNYDYRQINLKQIQKFLDLRANDIRFKPYALLDFFSAARKLLMSLETPEHDGTVAKILKEIPLTEFEKISKCVSEFISEAYKKSKLEIPPVIINEKQCETVLKELKTLQEKAMFYLMAFNGLSFDELFDLGWHDISFSSSSLQVINERENIVEIHLTQEAAKVLKELKHVEGGKRKKIEEPYIFKRSKNSRLRFNRVLRKALNNKEIEVDHLKFTAGRFFYNKGILIENIQRTLRLKNINDLHYCYEENFEERYFKAMKGR